MKYWKTQTEGMLRYRQNGQKGYYFMTIDTSKKPLTQLEVGVLNAYIMGMSYGHYKAYQRTLAEKRKKRAKKERAKKWTKERN